jgi:hypothetical protein
VIAILNVDEACEGGFVEAVSEVERIVVIVNVFPERRIGYGKVKVKTRATHDQPTDNHTPPHRPNDAN